MTRPGTGWCARGAGRERRGAAATLLALAVAALGLAHVAPAAASEERLYVTDETGGEVVVIDPGAGQVLGRIAVGRRPRGIRLSPDGRLAYVALSGSPVAGPGVDESKLPPADRRYDGIAVVDLGSGQLVGTLPGGTDPETFALAHDGRTLYVSNEETGQLSAVDLATRRVRATVDVGAEPEGVAVSADDATVYVACEAADAVYVVDARGMRVVARLPTLKRPRAVWLAGERGYATDEFAAALTVFSTANHAVLRTIALGEAGKVRPMAIESADGRLLYVTTGRYGALLEVDPQAGRVVRTIEQVGKRPWGLALSRDGRTAYTANGPSGDVAVIDLGSGRVTARIAVGGSPWGVVAAPAR